MDWIDVDDKLPQDGLEVLCAVTKFGRKTIDKSYHEPYIDKDGKKYWRIGEQVHYELLSRENGIWYDSEGYDFERNPDYIMVIAWADRLDYKLKE